MSRYKFDKACQAALAGLVKATGWKKFRSSIIREQDGVFLEARLNVYVNAPRTMASVELKPMTLDPILWQILQLEDNLRQPLSFRSSGAFVCPALRVFEQEVEVEGDEPPQVAARFLEVCERNSVSAMERLRARSFTELLREHPSQIELGSHSISLVAGLIDEGRLDEAARVAADYASGKSRFNHDLVRDDKSFHENALLWLSRRGPGGSGSS
jgi:hypothetical protein